MKRRIHLKCFALAFCCFIFNAAHSQNLLDTSTWTIGSGSVLGFVQNGSSSENVRVYGNNHIGENVILWRGGNDAAYNADGGWSSNTYAIDRTKTYRLSVWIKKTNSHDGRTYFGCDKWQGTQILNLNGTGNNNPYFWHGDLPQLDRWYLLVGYVHNSSYASSVSLGKIYDGVTGEAVLNITDFKFKSTSTTLKHRAYLFYDVNTDDRQYFYAPRMEVLDGAQSITELLRINEASKLKFTYDAAGNQTKRQYCGSGSCSSRISEDIKSEEVITESSEDDVETSFYGLNIFPNPTKSNITIKTSQESLIERITVFDIKGSLIQTFKYDKRASSINIDLSNFPVGVYYLHLHLENGESTTKKVIKN